MAGWRTTIEVKGLDAAREVARRVANLGENRRPLLEIAGSILEASTKRRFDEGRGPGGVPWPPSKRVLGTAVGKHGPQRTTGKTLVDTGDLEGSIRYVVRDDEVEIGVDGSGGGGSPHASALQFGSNRQAVVLGHYRTITQAFGVPLPPTRVYVRAHGMVTNLPPRPFIGVDDDDRRDVTEAWVDHLKGLLNG